MSAMIIPIAGLSRHRFVAQTIAVPPSLGPGSGGTGPAFRMHEEGSDDRMGSTIPTAAGLPRGRTEKSHAVVESLLSTSSVSWTSLRTRSAAGKSRASPAACPAQSDKNRVSPRAAAAARIARVAAFCNG